MADDGEGHASRTSQCFLRNYTHCCYLQINHNSFTLLVHLLQTLSLVN